MSRSGTESRTDKSGAGGAPTVSIIINTLDRAEVLERLLTSLRQLSHPRFEVIVVNGPSRDYTADLLARYDDVKSLVCPRPNLSESRNIGLTAAAGEVVVFIDDDALPASRDWLTELCEPFADESVGAVGGAVLHRDSDAQFEFRKGAVSDYAEQVFDGAATGEQGSPERFIPSVRGCNAAFRTSAIAEIGGFDERFSYYVEEADVCYRLSIAGYEIANAPNAVVRHYSANSARRTGPLELSWYEITRSDTYYCIKNGRDRLVPRVAKTIRVAPRKHFVRQMAAARSERTIRRRQWLWFLVRWVAGIAAGLTRGLLWRRRVRFTTPRDQAPSFIGYRTVENRDPLSIAILSQDLPLAAPTGGIGRYSLALGRGLQELGHQVHILTRSVHPTRHERLGLVVHGIDGHLDSSKFAEFPDWPVLRGCLTHSVLVHEKLCQMVESGSDIDVVHAPNWDLEGLATIRSRMFPVVLSLLTPLAVVINTEGWDANDDLSAVVALDRWQADHADRVVAPSAGVFDHYDGDQRVERELAVQTPIVPLGIEIALSAHSRPSAVALRSAGPWRILFVGRLERRKGIDTVLDSLPKLLAGREDWRVDIVGDDRGSVAKDLLDGFWGRHRAKEWANRVQIHGQLADDRLRELYEAADLFVAPSRYESFGLIFLEAMQFGIPVVGTTVGGIPSIVTDGVTGYLVPPGEAEAFAAATAVLMDDPDLRARFGDAGRDRALGQFSHVAMAGRFEAVFRETKDLAGRGALAIREALNWTAVPAEDIAVSSRSITEPRGEEIVRLSEPGASASFSVAGASEVMVILTGSPDGGTVSIEVEGTSESTYFDSYRPSAEADRAALLGVKGDPADQRVVTVTLLPWPNPNSSGNTVGIRSIRYRPGSVRARDRAET